MRPLLALTIFIASALYLQTGLAKDSFAVPPTENVSGISQSEWSLRWWKWANSFERKDSPISDQTGELCGSRQGGSLWFLAGTYGTHRTIRTCKIPKQKYLFFPLINYLVTPRVSHSSSCESVTNTAAGITDNPSALVLDLDGKQVKDLVPYRQATECFETQSLKNRKVWVYPSAANGYYVMLRPLSPGKHTLNFGGILPDMMQAVTYTLEVE